MSTAMRVTKYLKNNLRGKVNDSLFLDILECVIILINYETEVSYNDLLRLTDNNEKVIEFMVNRNYLELIDRGLFNIGNEFKEMLKRSDTYYYERYDIIDVF